MPSVRLSNNSLDKKQEHHTLDLDASYTSSQDSYLHINSAQSRSSQSGLNHLLAREALAGDEDDHSFEVVRNYESKDSVLPTYSPPDSVSHLDTTFGSKIDPQLTNRAAANSFDAYPSQAGAANNRDAMSEKTRLKRESGIPYIKDEKRLATGGTRYANLIPEHRPPRSPLDIAKQIADNEIIVTVFYLVLSLITRLWKIGKSPTVIWDEAHFGKFGSHYLKHEFYFDVHPPLGKMLVGLAGLLSGYGGQFEFKSGETYPDDVNYVGMRIILAMFGVAMVPIAWSTSGALGWNWRSRHFLTIMVLLDNAWLVISRFILLDAMLICFTFTTVHGLVKFHQYRRESFSEAWWFWLTFTGISIGCVASVKWVGLLATGLVGLYTIEDLWDKFGDLRMPVRTYARHWCARILCLIVIPIFVYMSCFKIHFMILSNSGPGDAQMSSLFQAHLRGNNFAQSPLEAAFGSKVTFKNMGYGGGLLHSHVQSYPVGSQQQQVTCYHYKDNNNDFIITPTWEDPPLPDPQENSTAPLRMLKSGDVIRLVHQETGRNIHSHAVPAPVTKENYEVSGYGNATVGDSNDYWVVEVVDNMTTGKKGKVGDPVNSLTTRLRFRHQNLDCYLRAANAILPQWGWKQVEVSCDKENNPKDEHTYWNIESHVNDRHKDDILASKPFDWPFLYNGLRMNSWADNGVKYYLMGNPAIWWGSSTSLFVAAAVLLWYLGRMQRRVYDLSPKDWDQFLFAFKVAGVGWLLHFVPFCLFSRVEYLHHYLPTLYFAVLMATHLLDHFIWNINTAIYPRRKVRVPVSNVVKNVVFVMATLIVGGTFWIYRFNSYGLEGSSLAKSHLKLRKSWNLTD